VGQWDSGTVGQWDSGTVGQWDSGTVGQWGSGAVGQWDSQRHQQDHAEEKRVLKTLLTALNSFVAVNVKRSKLSKLKYYNFADI